MATGVVNNTTFSNEYGTTALMDFPMNTMMATQDPN
jgi:hypothetical protein